MGKNASKGTIAGDTTAPRREEEFSVLILHSQKCPPIHPCTFILEMEMVRI